MRVPPPALYLVVVVVVAVVVLMVVLVLVLAVVLVLSQVLQLVVVVVLVLVLVLLLVLVLVPVLAAVVVPSLHCRQQQLRHHHRQRCHQVSCSGATLPTTRRTPPSTCPSSLAMPACARPP